MLGKCSATELHPHTQGFFFNVKTVNQRYFIRFVSETLYGDCDTDVGMDIDSDSRKKTTHTHRNLV
jgi:hypothetical protein